MTKRNPIKVGRQPPDEAALVVMFGFKLRLSRWGIGVTAGAVCAALVIMLVWMSPEQAGEIIEIILGP